MTGAKSGGLITLRSILCLCFMLHVCQTILTEDICRGGDEHFAISMRTDCVFVITFLCQGDSVVLQEDDFQTISNHGIVVDHLTDGSDQTDDHLGSVVSRSSLQEQCEVR